jgi:hypothetical protein
LVGEESVKTLFISLAFFTGQLISMQQQSVVHLAPHRDFIEVSFDGKLLELDNGPSVVHLPHTTPQAGWARKAVVD